MTLQNQIRALTSEGKGLAAYLTGTTNTLDFFAPSPPQLHVHGKTEIFIEWDPPKNLLGRLNYYELRMDNMVSAWMSEGRCESLPTSNQQAIYIIVYFKKKNLYQRVI
ncbi:uncharacterized protein LOC100203219 isoform X3 [Hydra vulgaris]|uniref:uncharacterized protein LOC100203219 isoform X3 n=1 Tax=Hydra vulgaris TaxID=6087 RepID=UPI001F5FAAAB|nr:uncharacterized protein LOC100203219 isoform X4 [Hydra vulgaris]